MWKIACHEAILEKYEETYDVIYQVLFEIEAMIFDIIKGVLIDASTLKYKGSLIVAAIFSVGIDLYTRLMLPYTVDKEI